ncbi:hypothetical protein [Burkholderia ubonensis]|uniref:hypothetical protein n=1 Tax=Burkholderia ubonensis TaxID=101571 RepID=UPI0012F93D1F|nr:hypothetical protein [Burkholderia ubonensis]
MTISITFANDRHSIYRTNHGMEQAHRRIAFPNHFDESRKCPAAHFALACARRQPVQAAVALPLRNQA